MSFPLKFSSNFTQISPSLKRSIVSSPRDTPHSCAIFLASTGLLDPANIFFTYLPIFLLGSRDSNPDCLDQNQVSCQLDDSPKLCHWIYIVSRVVGTEESLCL